MKKAPGAEACLGCMGHVVMENRNGLVVEQMLTKGSGAAELSIASDGPHPAWLSTTVDHSDIRGSSIYARQHNRDPSGAASD